MKGKHYILNIRIAETPHTRSTLENCENGMSPEVLSIVNNLMTQYPNGESYTVLIKNPLQNEDDFISVSVEERSEPMKEI
jgi:hypothetical protein